MEEFKWVQCGNDMETVCSYFGSEMAEYVLPFENDCQEEWRRREEIQRDIIYVACCKDNCNYVMKVLPKETTTQEMFEWEVGIQRYASQFGIAPKVYRAYITENEYVFVMDSMKKTLLSIFEDIVEDERMTSDAKISKMNDYLVRSIQLLDTLHKKRIYHGDFHMGNLMVDDKDTLCVIDFGRSRLYAKTTEGPFIENTKKNVAVNYAMFTRDVKQLGKDLLSDFPEIGTFLINALN
jgi:tRNA A-37 threonylcarbamoyl transferase component Bud32